MQLEDYTYNLSDIALRHSKIYHLLSQLFVKPPNIIFLRILNSSLKSIINHSNLPVKGLDVLVAFLNEIEKRDYNDVVTELSTEFVKLFRGVCPDSPDPPYESLYREGVLWGRTTFQVLKEYQKYGLSLNNNYRGEPPDHISFELSFMQQLCEREKNAWIENDAQTALEILDAEENFLRAHLMEWIGQWCRIIKTHDRLGFYSGWCIFLEDWINLHLIYVGDIKGQISREGSLIHETK